jgi:hypothetical protein
MVHGVVEAGGGVQAAASGLHAPGGLARAHVARALEDHVLQLVADARLGRGFVGAARVHEHPDMRQGEALVLFDQHAQAVFQAHEAHAVYVGVLRGGNGRGGLGRGFRVQGSCGQGPGGGAGQQQGGKQGEDRGEAAMHGESPWQVAADAERAPGHASRPHR